MWVDSFFVIVPFFSSHYSSLIINIAQHCLDMVFFSHFFFLNIFDASLLKSCSLISFQSRYFPFENLLAAINSEFR